MSPIMGQRKRTSGKGGGHRHPRESFHLPDDLRAALVRFVNDTRPRPSKSAVMVAALEQYLESRGYWPPPGGCRGTE
jgi:hypothetical protein